MGETVSEADKRVAQMLADKGWTVTPPAAETWVPANLNGYARADWLEGFRSHFEP